MKQARILFVIIIFFLGLVLASCVPGGTRPLQGWSGTAFDDGIVYVGSRDGKVVAVSLSSEKEEWSYLIATPSKGTMSCGQTSTASAIYGTPVVDGDLVYIGSYAGKVLALSKSARSQGLEFPQKRNGEWVYPAATGEVIGAIVGSVVVGENAIYVASASGRVYSLDKEFGDLNWESDVLGEKLWMTPVIEGDAIYVSTFGGYLYGLSTRNGALLWSFKADEGLVSSPVLYKDTIFAGSFGHNLYAVKIGSDKPLWKFSGGNWFWAAPVVSGGVVYAGCLDGKIYAINAETGEQLWAFDAESSIASSPVLMDDLLVVACDSGEVYILKTGATVNSRLANKISIGASIRSSLCVQEGMAYVRAQDNCLYALDIAKGEIGWKFPLTAKEES